MKKSLNTYAVMTITSILVFGAIAPTQMAHAGNPLDCQNVDVQILALLDGSGSINQQEFNLMISGISDAVDEVIPIDGTVEFSVVQFGGSTNNLQANVEISPTVISSQGVKDQLITDLGNIVRLQGWTPMHLGIDQAVSTLQGSNFFGCGPALINLVTDGNPQISGPTQQCDQACQFAAAEALATASATAAMSEIDGLSGFGIGNGVDLNYLRDNIVFPTLGVIITPPEMVPNPLDQGFVVAVATFEDFSPAFQEKLQQEVFQMMIGGEILSIDTASLLIAGINANSYSILGVLTMLGAAAFGAVYYTSKRKD